MFCYVHGEFTVKAQTKSLMHLVKKAYELHFGCNVGDQDKPWAPHINCGTCASKIRKWLQGSRPSMPFALQTVWSEQPYHIRECDFCLTNVKGFSAKSKHGIQYPYLSLAVWTVPRDGFPIPKPPSDWAIDDEGQESFLDNRHGATTSIVHEDPDLFLLMSSPHLIIQQELNDLVRDLNLSQTQ
jgi:hypothetical protein